MKAAMLAHDLLVAGSNDVMVAGGMESMTNAPVPAAARRAAATGWATPACYDHMFLDGLEDAYDKGRLMGTFAEDCADQYGFTREAQDAFALALADARARRQQRRHVRAGRSRRSRSPGRKGDAVDRQRRAAGQGHRRRRSRR